MNWVVRIADDAQLFIQNLPDKTRRQVSGSISQLEQDPFRGNVKPLKGEEWKGYYRKRVGDYRIIFFVHHDQRLVDVSRVMRRSEKTYRLSAVARMPRPRHSLSLGGIAWSAYIKGDVCATRVTPKRRVIVPES